MGKLAAKIKNHLLNLISEKINGKNYLSLYITRGFEENPRL